MTAALDSADLLNTTLRSNLAETIADRLSQELIVALVGPVGSGVTTAAGFIANILARDFGYHVAPLIKPSDIIKAEAHRVGIVPPPTNPIDRYIDAMQTAGNLLRAKFGPNYLAEKTIERIVSFRQASGGYVVAGASEISKPGRRAYIIDSIKNMDELDLLRQVYRESLIPLTQA